MKRRECAVRELTGVDLSRCDYTTEVPDHSHFASLIRQIADLLRGPYLPPQYERVVLPGARPVRTCA